MRNSLKFTDSGAIRIKASYNPIEEELVIHIVDSGAGIEKEEIERLFSRFGKLQRTAAINSEGVGLGLTIVKQVVDANNGQI